MNDNKMNDYKYELKYTHCSDEVTMTFRADITAHELAGMLRRFLLAACWPPEMVDEIIVPEEE